jgi:hypothetical protein
MKARFPWRGVILGLVFCALFSATLLLRFGCTDADRQACIDHGGRVLEVHAGRGWVCEEAR